MLSNEQVAKLINFHKNRFLRSSPKTSTCFLCERDLPIATIGIRLMNGFDVRTHGLTPRFRIQARCGTCRGKKVSGNVISLHDRDVSGPTTPKDVVLSSIQGMVKSAGIPGLWCREQKLKEDDTVHFRWSAGSRATVSLYVGFNADPKHDGLLVPCVQAAWSRCRLGGNQLRKFAITINKVVQLAYAIENSFQDYGRIAV